MTADQESKVQLLLLRGVVAGLPAADQERVHALAAQLRAEMTANGDLGRVAFALVGAEMAAED